MAGKSANMLSLSDSDFALEADSCGAGRRILIAVLKVYKSFSIRAVLRNAGVGPASGYMGGDNLS